MTLSLGEAYWRLGRLGKLLLGQRLFSPRCPSELDSRALCIDRSACQRGMAWTESPKDTDSCPWDPLSGVQTNNSFPRVLGGKGPEGKAEKASRLFERNLQAYDVPVRSALRPKFRTTTPFEILGGIRVEGKATKGPSTFEHNHLCEPFLSETLIKDTL
jgi:hypothetical protein